MTEIWGVFRKDTGGAETWVGCKDEREARLWAKAYGGRVQVYRVY